MTDHSDNVKNYLRNVLDYFVQIRQNYYTEHARLKQLNTKFDQFWNIITGALQISDPSILRRGRIGDISAEEMHEIVKESIQKYYDADETTDLNNANEVRDFEKKTTELLMAIQTEFERVVNSDNPSDVNATTSLTDIKTTLLKEHNEIKIKQLKQMQLMDNAIAFNKIFSAIKTPVVQLFAIKDAT